VRLIRADKETYDFSTEKTEPFAYIFVSMNENVKLLFQTWQRVVSGKGVQFNPFSRYNVAYAFAFLHNNKNVVNFTRNYNLTWGSELFSQRSLLHLFTHDDDLKSILGTKAGTCLNE
jgi:hypothetical protein